MNYFDCLARLSQAPGPSGFEERAADVAYKMLAPLTDEVRRDRLGSVIGLRRCGKENAPKILLDAHLDEVGLIVTGIEEGFLRFSSLGGIDPRILPDREITVLTDPPILGVVAVKPPHVMNDDDKENVVPIKDLYLDIGMSQAQAEQTVPLGTPMVYREDILRLAGDRIAGKSLDDRACFAILLRTLELLEGETLNVDVAVLGSCFEETSGDGALVATFAERPDCAIAVDVTFGISHDGPEETGFALGKGPAVGIGPNCARWMVDGLRKACAVREINWNPEVMAGNTGTNGWEMQVAREGVPVALVSLPLNYMHTPLEVISEGDAEQTARLLADFLLGLREEDGVLCWKN
ncbi:MAG: M42 family peptidase [Clostridiales bacterium]|nr:M42 family peptidase [Clostridiales bacterium]